MVKSIAFIALIVSTVCWVQVNGMSLDEEHFFVEGKVYCDPCRVQFETKLARPLSDVKVKLECTKIEDGSLTYSIEGKTDKDGVYSLPVDGDHEDENCELKTLKSSHSDCNEVMNLRDSDRIVLTRNMGVSSMARYVNALGFMTKTVDPQCADVIKQLGLDKDDD